MVSTWLFDEAFKMHSIHARVSVSIILNFAVSRSDSDLTDFLNSSRPWNQPLLFADKTASKIGQKSLKIFIEISSNGIWNKNV